MKLNNLKPLYQCMRLAKLERVKFDFRKNNRTFNVFFFIDETPFILLFGLRGGAFAFEVKVKKGFEIDNILPACEFRGLCEALGIRYDPDNKFSTFAFFTEFNKAIPSHVTSQNIAIPRDIAEFRREIEESERIYFSGWRDNNAYGTHVSQANLDKTRLLLGTAAYNRCLANNISSRWSDDPQNATGMVLP